MKGKIGVILLVSFLAGCQHEEHLPTYPRADEATTLAALVRQSKRIWTMSGSGTLELSQPNGQNVRLEVAVVLQPPDRARVRAWKFGSAVFDLTVLPEGVWLESSHDSAHANQAASVGSTAAPVAKAWSLLGGGFFSSPNLVASNNGQWLIVRSEQANAPSIVCRVDRDTLTAREYKIEDELGKARFTLTLDHYEDFAGILWPRRIVATSEAGKVAVDLTDIELNGELSPLAFKPPRRAEKLP